MINRRVFVAGLGAVLAAPFATEAQQTLKVPRVDYRFAEGHVERVPALVNELLATGIDVLFAPNPHVLRVAIQATTTFSIVGIDLETEDAVEAGNPARGTMRRRQVIGFAGPSRRAVRRARPASRGARLPHTSRTRSNESSKFLDLVRDSV